MNVSCDMEAEFSFSEADFGCAGPELIGNEQQRYHHGSTACFASANTSGQWAGICPTAGRPNETAAAPGQQNHLLQPNSLAAIRLSILYSHLHPEG